MIDKLKNVGIVATIAILLAVFILSLTNAIYPNPEYDQFCNSTGPSPVGKFVERQEECKAVELPADCRGQIDYKYDSKGCPTEAICNNCYKEFDNTRKTYELVLFVVASITGLIATLFGVFYKKKDEFWTLIKAGLIIGGLLSVFIGTGIYYHDMGRFLRPIVIFLELCIVVLVTYTIIKKKI